MDDQNTEYEEYEDYEALHDELFALLDQHRMKALSQKLNEMNEFDISEFLGELWGKRTGCKSDHGEAF